MLNKNANTKTKLTLRQRTVKFWLLATAALLAALCVVVPMATADQYEQKIKELQTQNGQTQQQTESLKVEADGLQATINALNVQIVALQKQITDNQAKAVEIQHQINAAQIELDRQKHMLGENIKAMYLEGEISTIEMLASSKDLSEYFDKQEYRDIVKSKIKSALDTVAALKTELRNQQVSLQVIIDEQRTLRTQLSVQQSEQDRLLGLNQSQQTALDKQIKDNFNKIAELRRQQAIENAKLFGANNVPAGVPGGGGYPGAWAFAPMDSMLDSWGMYNRQCVSYTAWKVWSTGRHMPGWGWAVRGNANQWDDNAYAAGIPTDNKPRSGDIAVSNYGTYGHVMYVEVVADDGSIFVSDYNQQWDGLYRQYWISASTLKNRNLVYIHFP